MKCLIVVANPSATSFTNQLVTQFKAGLESEGHTHDTIQLFQDGYENDEAYRQKILECDAICYAFPWWFEMPPYPLVAFLQRNLVEGFAFKHENGNKVSLLKKVPTQVLITMGQSSPEYNIRAVRDGLRYVGMKISGELVCMNVGPRLEPSQAQKYLDQAFHHGQVFLK